MLTPFSVPALSGTPRSGDERTHPGARQSDPTPMRVSPTLVRVTGGHGSSVTAVSAQCLCVVGADGGALARPIGHCFRPVSGGLDNAGCHDTAGRGGAVCELHIRLGAESRIAAGHSGSLLEFTHGAGVTTTPGSIAPAIRETQQEEVRRVTELPARTGHTSAIRPSVPFHRIHQEGETYRCNDIAPHRRLPGTVSDHGRFVIYSGKGIPMGNKVHRLEPTRAKNGRITELILWMAMRDQVMDPKEREAYELSLQVGDEVGEELGMDNLIANLQKMRRPTASASLDYTNALAGVVDLQIVDLGAERREREAAHKIVELFPQHRNEEA